MLSYTRSPARSRIDGDGACTTSTPRKEVATQLLARGSPSLGRNPVFQSSPSYRLQPRTLTNNEARTYRDREEDVRDDTLTHTGRDDWGYDQRSRFQTRSPPIEQGQVCHRGPTVNRQQQHYAGDGHWTVSQASTHQARTRIWSENRPVFQQAGSDREGEPRYLTSSYPRVAQSQHHEGYVMQLPVRSSSFGQHVASQSHPALLHSQATSPPRRYEDSPHRFVHSHQVNTSRNTSSYIQAPPQLRFGSHLAHRETFVDRQRSVIQPRDYASSTSTSATGMVPVEAYERQAPRWSSNVHRETTKRPRLDQRASVEACGHSGAHSSSLPSIGRWSDVKIRERDTKPPAAIEPIPSRQSDESTASILSAQELLQVQKTGEAAKCPPDSTYGYRPVISEDSSESCEPARPKRMRLSHDRRTAYDAPTSSLELLCSATLDLGPLQENVTGCSCPRSHCIKLYCDCFKAGRRCSSNCSCTNCKNTVAESGINGARTRAIKNILARNPRAFTGNKKEGVPRKPGDLVCNCVKSRCLKLYCDCFQKGKLCNEACLCVSCLNTEEENHVGGRRKLAVQQILAKRPDAFTKKPKEVGSGCACKNNRCLKKYCDCFRFNLLCTEKCVCKDCGNMTPAGTSRIEQV